VNFDSRNDPKGADEDNSGSVDATLSGSAISGILYIVVEEIHEQSIRKEECNFKQQTHIMIVANIPRQFVV